MTIATETPSRRHFLSAGAVLAAAVAGAAIATPAIATVSTTGLAVMPAPANASAPETPSPELPMESQEFQLLVYRLCDLFHEGNEAADQERAACVRFKAEAPLRPKNPPSKYPGIYYDIVRDEPPHGAALQALKARKGKPIKTGSGNPLGVRFKKSVLKAYHDLADKPFYTKEGQQDRKMMGASQRWENALHASARETGYESARHRRRIADKDMREVVAEILKHKPKTVEGLRMQAAACLAEPHVQWIQQANAAAFLTSVIEFGNVESERVGTQ
jgi:hypothetical protein